MDIYENPLVTRYGSKEMLFNFSSQKKFSTWRKLWYSLAKAQKELGLDITEEQLKGLEAYIDNIDFDIAKKRELETRHDVMSHVFAYGEQVPCAKGIIHLGATSAYVGDNTDLIVIKEGLQILKQKLVTVMSSLADFALEYKDLPTLGFTHFQPAQLTTVGKRATLWLQSLLLDLEELEEILQGLRFRGVKGTTGTQASYLELFGGDYNKVKQLDDLIAKDFGFEKKFLVTGQTYDRKVDSRILKLLGNIAQSSHKFTNDLRLLQSLKELEEPFGKKQIGSSAMAYKRNPMRSERIASLAKFVMSLEHSVAMTASTQWLERTLDDSANKRLSIPQGFLAVDAILVIWENIMDGLVVYPKMIEKHILDELPFMATEYLIMEEVKRGGDRQEIHEVIREHSMVAGSNVKNNGGENNLLDLLNSDARIKMDITDLQGVLDPSKFIGFAPEQTEDFLKEEIRPILEKYQDIIGIDASLNV